MNKVFGVLLVGLLLSVLAGSDVAWAKNWNQNKKSVSASNLKCRMLLQKYTSPSINGCVFGINASGSISFKRNGRTGSIEVCNPNATERDVKEVTKNLEGFLEPVTLLITNHENGYSGKIIMQWSGTPIETELPFMEKDFSGTAKAVMDTGINIRLKVKEKAELALSGDMGLFRLRGRCEADNATVSNGTNLQKASEKKVCGEVAIVLGEEGTTFGVTINNEDGTIQNQDWIDEAKRRWGNNYLSHCKNIMRLFQVTDTSPTSSTTTSSKIDKAKSTCTELGFTAGTEKHGECVLKVIDY